ncbi:MAG: glutathione synthase [Betaproteobacteria bacterium]|nr:MAG: glutathione synthase [Betaproteobacteria bacterium]
MRIAFIADPLSSFKTYKDSTYAMMVEAAKRGHDLYFMLQECLMWKGGRVIGETSRLTLTGDKVPWYRIASPKETPLDEFEVVLMRKDPPFDTEYVASTWLLELAQEDGAKVFNEPRAIRDHSEKLAIAKYPQFSPPTLVTRLAGQLQEFIDTHRDVVLKPLDGMGGQSVFRVASGDPNRNVIVETLVRDGAKSVMAQRYIPEIREGDKRILLIAGKAVPHCLARIPKPGETRGNLAAGGTGVAKPLSRRDLEIANALGPELARQGLLLVGLDVIGDWLTEINVTSPTCFREITDQTGFDVAGMFLDAVEAAVS